RPPRPRASESAARRLPVQMPPELAGAPALRCRRARSERFACLGRWDRFGLGGRQIKRLLPLAGRKAARPNGHTPLGGLDSKDTCPQEPCIASALGHIANYVLDHAPGLPPVLRGDRQRLVERRQN